MSSLGLPSLQHLYPLARTKGRTNPGTEMLLSITCSAGSPRPWFHAAKQPLASSSVRLGESELTESPEGMKDSAISGVGTPLKVSAPLGLCSMTTEQ